MEHLNRLFRISLLLLSLTNITQARLGETPSELTDRYGSPKKYQESLTGLFPPFLAGAHIKQYERGNWIIVAAFLDITSPAIRIRFRKKSGSSLTGEEITTILRANCSKMTWRPELAASLGEAVLGPSLRIYRWKRDDGATAILQDVQLQFDSPDIARHQAQRKQKHIQKAREDRPKF